MPNSLHKTEEKLRREIAHVHGVGDLTGRSGFGLRLVSVISEAMRAKFGVVDDSIVHSHHFLRNCSNEERGKFLSYLEKMGDKGEFLSGGPDKDALMCEIQVKLAALHTQGLLDPKSGPPPSVQWKNPQE